MGAQSYDLTKSGRLKGPQQAALQRYLEENWLSPAFLASYPPASAQPGLLDGKGAALLADRLPPLRKHVLDSQRRNQKVLQDGSIALQAEQQLLTWHCQSAAEIPTYTDPQKKKYCSEQACCFPHHPTTMAGQLSGGSGPLVIRKLYTPDNSGKSCNIAYQKPDDTGTTCSSSTAPGAHPCQISCTDDIQDGTVDLRDCLIPYRFDKKPCYTIDNVGLTGCTTAPVVPLDGITLDDKRSPVPLRWDQGVLRCGEVETLPPSPCSIP